jgi:hypothetical protein
VDFARTPAPAALTVTADPAPAGLTFGADSSPSELETDLMADSGPATGGVAITLHDSNPISPVPRSVHVGVGGDIACRFKDSSADVTLKGVPDGAILPYRLQYARATGTTATDLVALY